MLATKQDIDSHCFDKAQQLDRDWLVPLESAMIYAHYDVASKSQARARVAMEAAPDKFYCWFVYGGAQQSLGLRRQAKESYEQCLKLCPRHVEATKQLETLVGGGFLTRAVRGLFGRG